jgi:CrcB protein
MQAGGFVVFRAVDGRDGGAGVTYLAISIGAVLGANARFLLGGWVADRLGAGFPYGTLLINVSGSFVIGIVLTLATERAILPSWVQPAVAIGFLGSYTTFSTFSYETLSLVGAGSTLAAGVNIAANVGGALVGVYLGTVVARLV